MLSALITSQRGYPTMCLWQNNCTPVVGSSRSSHYRDKSLNFPRPSKIGTELSHDVLNPAAYRFKWWTAIPLGPTTAPGCDEPTSRCKPPVDVSSGEMGLLSPAYLYLWSDAASTQNHPDHYDRYSSAVRLVGLTVSCLMLLYSTSDFQPFWTNLVSLRYI